MKPIEILEAEVQSLRTQLEREKRQTAEVETWLRSADREREKFQKQAFELAAQLEEKAREIARLRIGLAGIIELGKRDLSNPKYDGYFEQASQALTPPERKP